MAGGIPIKLGQNIGYNYARVKDILLCSDRCRNMYVTRATPHTPDHVFNVGMKKISVTFFLPIVAFDVKLKCS